jgi:outer membrane immunogenic protein
MKSIRIIPATVIAALIASPVFAADMPLLKAPAAAPVESTWNGFYFGGEVGGKWVTENWNTTCVQAGPPLGVCGSPLNAIIFPGAPDSSASNAFSTTGLRTGIYLGFMFQTPSNWVVGFEGDVGFYNRSSSVPGLLGCSTAACTGGALVPFNLGGDSTRVTDKNDLILRLRAGYLVTPSVLVYATGGVAFQDVESSMTCSGATSPACLFFHTQTQTALLTGYTVGGGLEWKLFQNWLLRGEYRYSDVGSYSTSFFRGSGDVELFANIHVKSQIATAGLAYMFPMSK